MNCIKEGLIGQIVGDALGLPVQFVDRSERDADPVSGMRGYGAFNMPPGSWSDDSSLILATVDGLTGSLKKEIDTDADLSLTDIIDYELIMKNFSSWLNGGEFTPYGFGYDVGGATMDGIGRYENGCEAIKSGGNGERDNGNGSLMRILPIAFVIYHLSQKHSFYEDDRMTAVHNLSSLTHRHRRSQMTCGIYINIALEFIENQEKRLDLTLEEMIRNGIVKSKEYYYNNDSFRKELHHFDRVFSLDIQNLPRDEIKSGGYTISSLEASIWCLLNNESYNDTILTAVNLGHDTDTTACIVGGLAGIYYGYDNIPEDWINELAELEYIEGLIDEFDSALSE